jgi:hypothetical protein
MAEIVRLGENSSILLLLLLLEAIFAIYFCIGRSLMCVFFFFLHTSQTPKK